MKDNDAIARRERVFDQLREANTARTKLDKRYDELRTQLNAVQKEISDSDTEVRKLSRLIQVMIFKDCCPVEAQLKYSDELEDPNSTKESADYGVAEASYNATKPSLLQRYLPNRKW